MPAQFCACVLSARQLVTRTALLAMVLAVGVPAPFGPASAHEPSDPDAPSAETVYESVLGDYDPIEIVKKPDDWRAANDLAEELDGPRGQLLPPGNKPVRRKPK